MLDASQTHVTALVDLCNNSSTLSKMVKKMLPDLPDGEVKNELQKAINEVDSAGEIMLNLMLFDN